MTTSTNIQRVISNAEMLNDAPAVFQTEPYHRLTDRYSFMPTIDVIDQFRSLGWQTTLAKEVKMQSRSKERKGFAKHMVTMRHPDFMQDVENIPQVLISNSHDGKSNFEMMMGIFRLVCSNGLVIQSADYGSFKMKHMNFDMTEALTITEQFANHLPKVLSRIDDFKKIELDNSSRHEFAKQAATLRLGDSVQIDNMMVMNLLDANRKQDDGKSLWTTYNTVQENIINGAFEYASGDNRRKAKPIAAIDKDITINKGLWSLAESFAN